MEEFLSATVRGLGQGSLYALLGLGFVIVFKSTRVVNFAAPALMIFGAYFTSALAVDEGVPFFVAIALAILATAAVAGVVERATMRPMIGKPPFSAAMVTIGVFFVLEVFAGDLIGLESRQVGDPFGLDRWTIGDVAILHIDVARIVAAVVVVVALAYFFKYSRYGLAMRATALSSETALAQGIPVARMFSLSWMLAGAIAALAGVFVGGGGGFESSTALVALKALPAIILGGLDSIRGAIVGGVIIGLAEAYTKQYQAEHLDWAGSNFDQVIPYLVMLIVLLVRPYGLFGTREVDRV